MGCVGSDGEDELRAIPSVRKRVKFSKKSCDDFVTTVDYASVPRKLRSAVKKRTRGSLSPHLLIPKKLNCMDDGIEFSRNDGLKKYKASMKHRVSSGSVSEVVVGPVTKDEEDVAETLYALAGMFSEKTSKNKTKLEDEQSKTKSTAFLDEDSSRPTVKAIPKEEAGIKTTDRVSVEAPNHSSEDGGTVDEGVSVQSPNEVSQVEKSLSRKLFTDLHHKGPKLDLPPTVLNSNAERGTRRLPFKTFVPGDSSSTNKGPGSNINQPELSLASGKKFESAFKLAANIGGQYEQYTVSENKSNGLSSTMSHNSDVQGLSMKSFTTKSPAVFPNTSCSLQPSISENYVAMKKDPWVQVDSKKSWKRCSTHVLISHFIKDLQKSERATALIMQSTQLIKHEGLNQEALITSNSLTERSNGLNRIGSTNNGICSAAERNSFEVRNAILHKRLFQDQRQDSTNDAVCSATQKNSSEVRNSILLHRSLLQDQQQASTNSVVGSSAGSNSSEVRNAILLHKRLLQDQQQAATTPGLYTSQKQDIDFFTIPGRESRGETSLVAAKPDSCLTTMAHVHIPYLQSKDHQDIPFQLRGNFYLSTPSNGHQGAAASGRQVQLAPYLGSSSYAPSVGGVTASSKQAAWQQQHQNCGDQLSLHQKTRQDAGPNSHNWLNEVQDGAYLLHPLSLFPPSHYASQQQQTLITLPKVQGQHHHMTYGYQGNEGGRPPESVTPCIYSARSTFRI